MNYELRKKAKKLSEKLKLVKQQHNPRYKDVEALHADNEWAVSHLLAKLLFKATIKQYTYLSAEEVQQVYTEFTKNEKFFDLETLYENYWLRTIGEIVEISDGIRGASQQYQKIKDAEIEFDFLVAANKNFKPDSPIEKNDFNNFLNAYCVEKGLTVSLEKCKTLHFIDDKDEKIKIQNIPYNKPIFEHKYKLAFISCLQENQKQGDKNKLTIEADALNTIYEEHKRYFPKTPALSELLRQKILVVEDGIQYINLLAGEPNYWVALNNKIGALLWDLLNESGEFTNKKDLLQQWILKLEFIDSLITAPDVMKRNDTNELIKTALDILVTEPDLIGCDAEINKLILSARYGEFLLNSDKVRRVYPDLKKAKNIFELYELMEECNEAYHNDLLWKQETRWMIDKMIQVVVFYSEEVNEEGADYYPIRRLLSESINRPYLLWRTCFYIYYWRPEIIPYLIADTQLLSLAFYLCFITETDSSFSQKQAGELTQEILSECFDLLLSAIVQALGLSDVDKTLPIFECLKFIAETKWFKQRHTPFNSGRKNPEVIQAVYDKLIELLKQKELPGSYYQNGNRVPNYFFPQLVKQLFLSIKKYDSLSLFNEGVIGIPVIKFELLRLLITLINSNEYKAQENDVQGLDERQVVEEFFTNYLFVFNLSEVKTRFHHGDDKEGNIPIWSTNVEKIEAISWYQFVLCFEKYDLLNQFIHPINLQLRNTENKWDKYNDFTIDKIRTHVEILLLSHAQLQQHELVYQHQGLPVANAIAKIEQGISDLISKYSREDSLHGKADIFDDRHERYFFSSERKALLPVVAQALNKFEQRLKEQILTSLTITDSFTKCLKLLEFLSSEADKNFIKKQIHKLDVAKYLDEKNYIPQIELVLLKLSEYEEFIDKAKEALDYWEKRILRQRDKKEYQITYYRTKLLIAYHQSDEDTVLLEPKPDVEKFHSDGVHGFNAEETKNFYLGLIKLKKNEAEQAYKLFSGLMHSAKDDKAAIAINRLYAHISIADKTDDINEKNKILSDALLEWDEFENMVNRKGKPEALHYVLENVWINKLHIYNKLKRYPEFDSLFNSLDKAYKLRQAFFDAGIESLMERDFYEQARALVKEAEAYHHDKDDSIPEFVRAAIQKLENEDDYKRLRKEFLDLIHHTPEKLMLLLPENIVGIRDLSEYILKEICNSANDMLDIVTAVEEIEIEDKYTDILILSLKSRLKYWGWQVGNSRGGFSSSNKRNSGELDFVINAADGERIATFEALLIYGKNTSTVSSHAIKSFNYDHRRKLFFVINYYLGKEFENHWQDYLNNILPHINFPQGFPLKEGVQEINAPFINYSVKAALAKHANDTSVYHIFINCNYKLIT